MTAHPDSDVIVVGAGYAGVLAANRLAARRHRVTLINDGSEFVERVRLHEVVAGTRATAARPLTAMLRPSVTLVNARVVALDDDRVHLAGGSSPAGGSSLAGRYLLWAAGSRQTPRHREWIAIGSHEGAHAAAQRVSALPAGGTVAVHGAGLSGIETAAEIAERRPDLRVRLVDPRGLGPSLHASTRRHVHAGMQRLGVDVLPHATASDLHLDCTGLAPVTPADDGGAAAPLSVDQQLRVVGRDRWWGAGDAVAVAAQPHLRMGCATALPMGLVAADNIDAALRGEDPRPFDFGFLMQCLSLGRRDGAIMWVDPGDAPTGRVWTGPRAALTKESVCRMALAVARTGGILFRWPKGPR